MPHDLLKTLVAQTVKYLPTMWETRVQSVGREDILEKEMATHSSILAWKIPWTEKPGRLQPMGLQRVRHDWAASLWLSRHKACTEWLYIHHHYEWVDDINTNMNTMIMHSRLHMNKVCLPSHLFNIFTEHPRLWLALCRLPWRHRDEYEALEEPSSALKGGWKAAVRTNTAQVGVHHGKKGETQGKQAGTDGGKAINDPLKRISKESANCRSYLKRIREAQSHEEGGKKRAGGETVVVQSLSRVWLCNPWTAVCHASLPFTIFWSLCKFMPTESVMPSNHPILCSPLLLLLSVFPGIKSLAWTWSPPLSFD